MKVLVIGGGGREHAIVTKLLESPRVKCVICAPGNGGIASLCRTFPIAATDVSELVALARSEDVDFVMVAPDDPLALGLVDELDAAGIPAFGPTKAAAMIEASKVFSKGLMEKYNIPTAKYKAFHEIAPALDYLRDTGAPIVVKADGLALGKGAFVCETTKDAEEAVTRLMRDGLFGDAGASVVIEEFMEGPEVTVLCFTDGKTIVPMPSSRDHKRAYDGDSGPNTGGMGAISPAPGYTSDIADYCMKHIFRPTVDAMAKEGRPFKGVLYFGLMLTKDGPKVVEYNARFGDPEAQVVLSLLESDLFDIFEAVVNERLSEVDVRFSDGAAACVVLASGGYPGKYKSELLISGLEKAEEMGASLFHAGTKQSKYGYITAGGRVLGVTCVGDTLEKAVVSAYRAAHEISFDGVMMRHDIGAS